MNMRRLPQIIACMRKGLWLITVLIHTYSLAQETPSLEYQVKAGFLYNFCQFVEWPDQAFQNPEAPLIIGIIGDDPFENYLDRTVQGERMDSHPIVVRRYKDAKDATECHIVFVNLQRREELRRVIALLEGRPILTVSDANNFVKNGGMIGFATEDNRTRININVEAARMANLTISSKLLRVANVE